MRNNPKQLLVMGLADVMASVTGVEVLGIRFGFSARNLAGGGRVSSSLNALACCAGGDGGAQK